ncbi:MAG: sulfotransferase, partial [Bacteroidales bacterium]
SSEKKYKNLFITGMARTGSTLLEKALHNHPELAIASQPFPYIYTEVKSKFLAKEDISTDYPLENYFLKGESGLKKFYKFLDSYEFAKDFVVKQLKEMKSYSGQYTHKLSSEKYWSFIKRGSFEDIYKSLVSIVAKYFKKKDASYYGTKEVFCEEYLPYILKKVEGARGVIIVRDPRDVITSLNYGQYKDHSGKRRPMLFDVRNWRKSIAFAIYLEKASHFKLIKYENLVRKFYGVMSELTDFFDVQDFPEGTFSEGIRDQDGNIWSGNSSFGNKDFVNASSIGRYQDRLSEATINFIEATCYPELKYLGYDLSIDGFQKKYVGQFSPPFQITRDFPADYSVAEENSSLEIQRFHNLTEKGPNEFESDKWFIFPEVYKKLREAI